MLEYDEGKVWIVELPRDTHEIAVRRFEAMISQTLERYLLAKGSSSAPPFSFTCPLNVLTFPPSSAFGAPTRLLPRARRLVAPSRAGALWSS